MNQSIETFVRVKERECVNTQIVCIQDESCNTYRVRRMREVWTKGISIFNRYEQRVAFLRGQADWAKRVYVRYVWYPEPAPKRASQC